MIPTPKGRSSSEDQNVQVGWRMAGLASETVSYVIAGGLLGWLADHELETDHWLATGFIVGIVTGIGVLLRGALKMNQALDRATRQKRRSGSDKADS
ncbi:MAG: hypothetical protein CMJ33_06860 [Phycisphaerae bacterium]|nr:hypothetical protein [Phycisphaerae bacterium]HAW95856.1 hypothetical protein [Phycisphaerales bacterium]|tara:strand:+ start:871 stop:1161 length:291 start_codon:yes stop_codon:yes gene_type:complete